MTDQIDQIIAKLTKAQREAVLSMPDKNLDRWDRKVRWPTSQVLRRVGLLAFIPLRPTPLGQQVRARLQEQSS